MFQEFSREYEVFVYDDASTDEVHAVVLRPVRESRIGHDVAHPAEQHAEGEFCNGRAEHALGARPRATSVEQVREAAALVSGRNKLEVSGGLSLDTVRAYAETGVDFISTGAITHSAPALDISMEIMIGA